MRNVLLTAFMVIGCILVVCNDGGSDLAKVANMFVFIVSVLTWLLFSRTGRWIIHNSI